MLSVKEAAAMLGCDERWIRERLNQGQLKGEKKTIGMKEKWFVYKGEIDAALARKGFNHPTPAPQINFEPLIDEPVDAESFETSDADNQNVREWLGVERETMRMLAEEMVKPLLETIKEQTAFLGEKERIIQEKDRQLRLLPDLQKQAEAERKAAESKALEVEALKKQIAAVEEQRQVAEQQTALLKSEKEAEAKAVQEQLAALALQLQELQKPKQSWWQKWFTAGE